LYYNVRPGAQAIPSVEGLTFAEATAQLHKAGWKNVTTSATPVASLKYSHGGQVVSTNPAAGKTVPLSTQIVLNVSGKSTAVPALVGLTRNQATATLNQAGLVYQTQIESGPPGTTPGTVWKSTPRTGKAVLVGGSVTIYVEPGTTSSPTPSPSSSSPTPSPSPSSSASP
jgi:eukaryotic-like serine/threonine-protein kinase